MSLGLKALLLILTVLASRMACLSLDEVHSSLRTFKSLHDHNRDKGLGNALNTVRRRKNEYTRSYAYGPYSLPVYAEEYDKRLGPFIKKQQEEVMDVPLGVSFIEKFTLNS